MEAMTDPLISRRGLLRLGIAHCACRRVHANPSRGRGARPNRNLQSRAAHGCCRRARCVGGGKRAMDVANPET